MHGNDQVKEPTKDCMTCDLFHFDAIDRLSRKMKGGCEDKVTLVEKVSDDQ